MTTASTATPVAGRPRLNWAAFVLGLLVAWCVIATLAPALLYAFVRLRWPGFGAEIWAAHMSNKSFMVLWCVHSGIAALCGLLLFRRSARAVWPAAGLAAWRVGAVYWLWLNGKVAASDGQQIARWGGLASVLLVVAGIVWLRARRTLR